MKAKEETKRKRIAKEQADRRRAEQKVQEEKRYELQRWNYAEQTFLAKQQEKERFLKEHGTMEAECERETG